MSSTLPPCVLSASPCTMFAGVDAQRSIEMHEQSCTRNKHLPQTVHWRQSVRESQAGEAVSGETSPLTISTSEVAKQPLALMTGNVVRLVRQHKKKKKLKNTHIDMHKKKTKTARDVQSCRCQQVKTWFRPAGRDSLKLTLLLILFPF